MIGSPSRLDGNEKEALLIMFGSAWQKRFWPLDGQKGRPSLSQCIDFALRKRNSRAEDDLISFVESYLNDMSRRCYKNAMSDWCKDYSITFVHK